MLSHAEIAGALRSLCGDEVAAREREVAVALSDAPDTVTDAHPLPELVAGAATATISVVLRDESLRVSPARRRRRWGLAAAGALVAAAAAVAVLASRDDRHGVIASAGSAAGADPVARTAPHARVDLAAPPRANPAPAAATASEPTTAPARTALPSPPAPVDDPPASRAVGAPRPRAHRPARPAEAKPASQRGYYAVDSKPYASIYIDGAPAGDTPLFRLPLAAGPHTVRAVLVDGRQRTFQIQIGADREVRSVLAW